MKKLCLLTLFLLAACGMVREEEAPAPFIKYGAKPALCQFPKAYATKENVVAGVDCLQKNLDNAFDSILGKTNNELSIAELKKLQEEGLLDFAIGDPRQWDGISGLLSLVHPQGKNAISRPEITRFISWLRTRAEFVAKFGDFDKYKGEKAPLKYAFFREMMGVAEELISFISSKGQLSLEQAQAVIALGQSNNAGAKANVAISKLQAAWTLKALILESTYATDTLRGSSLKTFIRLGIQAAQQIDKTYQWWETDFHPAQTPQNIESEWQGVLELAKSYFRQTTVFDIDTDEMRAQIRVLFPHSDFPDRIPDLVKTSRKLLAQSGDTQPGLLYGLLHLFDHAERTASELRAASPIFAHCKNSSACPIPIATALTDPTLKPVTFVSASDWNVPPLYATPMPRRRGGFMEWKTVLNRFIEKGVMNNIFGAFDTDNDALIPYKGESPEDLREAMDIAYNVISLLPSVKQVGRGEAAPLYIKPSAVIGAIGLIADEWVVPGNGDGKIDENEFFAAIKVYEDINTTSRQGYLSLPLHKQDDDLYVSRSAFIQNIGSTYQNQLPYLVPVFDDLNRNNGGASNLMDLIVPKRGSTYIDRADTLVPVSILVLLDRLIVKCDKDEDEHFNWDELSCVVPLALSAGRQIFTSGIFEFPLFLSDSAKLSIDTLGKKGLAATLAKVVFINGSTSKVRVTPEFIEFAKKQMKGNTHEIAALFTLISVKTESTLRKEVSVAVRWAMSGRDGVVAYFGGGDPDSKIEVTGVSGWNSVIANLIKKGMVPAIVAHSGDVLSQEALQKRWEGMEADPSLKRFAALKTLVPLSFVLGARSKDWKKVFNIQPGNDPRKMDPISPANILSVFEGLLTPRAQKKEP